MASESGSSGSRARGQTGKFEHPDWTATREPRATRRARPPRDALDQHRHALQHHLPELLHRIEPQQRPARLHHAAEAAAYYDEIAAQGLGTREIGFTGGEPFMNPHMLGHDRGRAGARLRGAGAHQRHAADAAPQDQERAPRPATGASARG